MNYSKLTQNELEHLLYNSFVNNTSESFYVKDLDSKFIAMSEYHAKYFGLKTIEEGLGKTDFDFFTKPHAQKAFDDEQELMRTRLPILGKLERETWEGDYVSYVITSKYPLYDDDNNVVGLWGHSINVASTNNSDGPLKQPILASDTLDYYLDETSQTDPLTKLNNVNAFYEMMNLFYQSAMNSMSNPTINHALLLIDINNFTHFNHKYGHQVGDNALIHVSDLLRPLHSDGTYVFRYGGDGFALLVENTDYDNVIDTANNIIDTLNDNPFRHEDELISIKINIGMSKFKESLPLGNIYDIINLTDKRLYAAQKLVDVNIIYDNSY